MTEFRTIAEIVEAAEVTLRREPYDHAAGGTEAELTARRNRKALDEIWLLPRVLTDVSQRTTATSFLGFPLSLPVILAPVGSLGMYDAAGALSAVAAAGSAGTAAFISGPAISDLEALPRATSAPVFLQVYIRGDRSWTREIVERAASAGYGGICLTVDRAVDVVMPRDIHNNYSRDTAVVSEDFPSEPYASQETWNWSDFEWLCSISGIPVILKGVVAVADVRRAVAAGASAIYVSNHGGRALDGTIASVDALGPVANAIGGEVPVLFDGGVRHGSDVVKALALGANVVLIGRLQCWGLAAGGQAGLEQVLGILQKELSDGMGLLGVTAVEMIDHTFVFPREY